MQSYGCDSDRCVGLFGSFGFLQVALGWRILKGRPRSGRLCADDRRSDLVLESEGATGFGFAQVVVELDGSDRELGLDASSE